MADNSIMLMKHLGSLISKVYYLSLLLLREEKRKEKTVQGKHKNDSLGIEGSSKHLLWY